MAHTVTTKYNPATGKITAKCWRASVRVDGYYNKSTLGDLEAHRQAVKVLLDKLNDDKECGMWHEVAAAEGIKANEYTFIIDYIAEPAATTEYRVTWDIDTIGKSYEDAARFVQAMYFAQGHKGYYEVKAKGDKHPVIVDFEQQ